MRIRSVCTSCHRGGWQEGRGHSLAERKESMSEFILYKNKKAAPVYLEQEAENGMEELADIFCGDVERVTGVRPKLYRKEMPVQESFVLVATCGCSPILDKMEKNGEAELENIRGKREVYGIFHVTSRECPGKKILLVAGSDKRGTIYGMFHISRLIGVSPWVFWADAVPEQREALVLDDKVEMISKEPSVRYRGFFINDEQPCFGNWAREKFGSIKPTPELYRHIFELLLRLKGNYLWPAMWRSDFAMDYIENAQLADRMGVIIGLSHHEPCCRSGGEFQTLRKTHKEYGEDWSFLSNAEGISRFWRDGLLRNKDFESVITIGMRGEFDSYLMPEDATLEDNINVLKDAIREQKRLIAECVPEAKHPQLLAVYKEVEDYYQGDEQTSGLKDWDVLKDDIMMLCDDNFGHVRALPREDERNHPGGFGMYYHFDYYGGPVSYLWMNSTPLPKIWEQMTMAYEYGVRDAWIVNVGDIKNQELPLSYFLDLAYDYDKWGISAMNQTTRYIKEWLESFGFAGDAFAGVEHMVEEYVRWNGMCRPEVLRADTYHPVHFSEAETMRQRVAEVVEKAEAMWEKVKDKPQAECFFQLVYYPVVASANVIQMNLYAGFNQFYAAQRKKMGNRFIPLVEQCIQKDRQLALEYHTRNNGRWNHMQSVYHIGYVGWNDEEWQYPDCRLLHPVSEPRLLVSISGEELVTGGNPWRRKTLTMQLDSLTKPYACIEVANGGEGILDYRMEWNADWLRIEPVTDEGVHQKPGKLSGSAEEQAVFRVCVDGDLVSGEQTAHLCIYGDSCEETAEVSSNGDKTTKVDVEIRVQMPQTDTIPAGVFLETDGCVSIEAPHFHRKNDIGGASWKEIRGYGKTLGSLKVFPVLAEFATEQDAPSVEYDFYLFDGGEYELQLFTAPNNPVVSQGKMRVAVQLNDGERMLCNTIPDEGYVPWLSPGWEHGVLEQIHKSTMSVSLNKGVNKLVIRGVDPAVVLEKIQLMRKDRPLKTSYLGMPESSQMPPGLA